MAYDVQWCNNYSVYQSAAALLNGTPYVALNNSTIVADPDPTTADGSKCFRPVVTGTGPRISTVTPGTFMRWAGRIWLTALPSSSSFNSCVAFLGPGAGLVYHFEIGPAGNMMLYADGSISLGQHGTLLADTIVPVGFANSWNHFEFAVDTSAGTFSVWKEGAPVASLTGTLDGSPPGTLIALISTGEIYNQGNGPDNTRIKDDVIATGSTQLGPVSVLRQDPDGTISSGWTAVNGVDERAIWGAYWNLLTFSANANANDVVLIDTTYYKFTSGSVDAGTPAGTVTNPWLVALGADAAASITNLFKAIGATGTPGTTYSTALTAHATVDAGGTSTTQLCITAKAGTLLSTACTVPTGGARMAWTAATLNEGQNDFSYMDAGSTLPAAAVVSLEDLPPWVTAIRAVMPLIRLQKSDGGTATVQDAMISGASSALGSDRTITTAFTYYWDVIEHDPATGALWTPAAFNAANAQVNRTS